MNEGQAVIVIDRGHYRASDEGTVIRAEPDELGRVRVRFPDQDSEHWIAIELSTLGAVPIPGERYEWDDLNNSSRVPFTVGKRLSRRAGGFFRIMADDATRSERKRGYTSVTSAAEIAKFAVRISEPDGADDGTTADAVVKIEPPTRLTFPPAGNAARARVLAFEHIRQARMRLDNGVPSTGRPWLPGDTPRLKVLDAAADDLARLCAVYLGGESDRNRAEAHAYALAFRLVVQSAQRLSKRRLS